MCFYAFHISIFAQQFNSYPFWKIITITSSSVTLTKNRENQYGSLSCRGGGKKDSDPLIQDPYQINTVYKWKLFLFFWLIKLMYIDEPQRATIWWGPAHNLCLIEAWGSAPSTPQVVFDRDVLLSAANRSGVVFQIEQCEIDEGSNVCRRLFSFDSTNLFRCISFLPRPFNSFWISSKEFQNLFWGANSLKNTIRRRSLWTLLQIINKKYLQVQSPDVIEELLWCRGLQLRPFSQIDRCHRY